MNRFWILDFGLSVQRMPRMAESKIQNLKSKIRKFKIGELP
jgi:hypothetical protein